MVSTARVVFCLQRRRRWKTVRLCAGQQSAKAIMLQSACRYKCVPYCCGGFLRKSVNWKEWWKRDEMRNWEYTRTSAEKDTAEFTERVKGGGLWRLRFSHLLKQSLIQRPLFFFPSSSFLLNENISKLSSLVNGRLRSIRTHQNTTTTPVPLSVHRRVSSQGALKAIRVRVYRRQQSKIPGGYFLSSHSLPCWHIKLFPSFIFCTSYFVHLSLFTIFDEFCRSGEQWKLANQFWNLWSSSAGPLERLFSRGSLSLHSEKNNDKKADAFVPQICRGIYGRHDSSVRLMWFSFSIGRNKFAPEGRDKKK